MQTEIIFEQGPALAEHSKIDTQEEDMQAPCEEDFPGVLSTQRFQVPYDESWDGGIWEKAVVDPAASGASAIDPFDGLALDEPIELW